MPSEVDGNLLVACAANVCRSPFAAFLLARDLPAVAVSSVGVTARGGDPLCRCTEDRILALPDGAQFVEGYSATRLSVEHIAQADLILTASEAERAAIAVLDPDSRPKTFTLIEAAHSARSLDPVSAQAPLQALAQRMHAQRGMVNLPQPGRSRLPWGRRRFGIAIPDAHMGEARRHDVVYRAISNAVDLFVTASKRASGQSID